MHAAVWSQPTGHRKLGQTQREAQPPESNPAKCVLIIAISLTFTGGLLIVFGLTGYFVRGNAKHFLSFSVFAGIVCIATGISGSKSVSRWETAKMCTNLFTALEIMNIVFCVILLMLASMVIINDPPHLLAFILAVGEVILGIMASLLSLAGLTISVIGRSVLINPLGAETRTNTHRNQNQNQEHIEISSER